MTKIAALFPGQGSQAVGMGQDITERWSVAKDTFSAVDLALDFEDTGTGNTLHGDNYMPGLM